MQSTEQHLNKPKISKSSTIKLPAAFMSSRNTAINPIKKVQQNNIKSNDHQITKTKSKNPFLPLRQCLKKMQQYDVELKSLQSNIDFDKFSKFSLEKNQYKFLPTKIRYQNCITIGLVKRYQKGCLKKILYVPTLTMHYLRQFPIGNIDKNHLHQWISDVNFNTGQYGLRVLELFWNLPQGSYSLLYQFFSGTTLDSLLQNLQSLPMSVLKKLIISHINSFNAIYSSQILLNQHSIIKYLPCYQQSSQYLSLLFQKISQYLNDQINYQRIQSNQNLAGYLGILLLISFFGQFLVEQNFNSLLNSQYNKSCCLVHDLLNVNNSFLSIYLKNYLCSNKQKFIDLLCMLLKYKRNNRINLNKILSLSFMIDQDQQINTLEEILNALQPTVKQSQIFINKIPKILDPIQLILQNVTQVKVQLKSNNQQIKCLAKQLGIQGYQNQLCKQLQKIYSNCIK